jgi:hypothetical protein
MLFGSSRNSYCASGAFVGTFLYALYIPRVTQQNRFYMHSRTRKAHQRIPRARLVRPAPLRGVCGVDKIDTAFGALPRALDEAHQPGQDDRERYTPGEFLKQAGLVIAVCLGLAMLAQFLVMVVGEY